MLAEDIELVPDVILQALDQINRLIRLALESCEFSM